MERQEHRRRLATLAANARQQSLDGVLLSDEFNIDYYGGFRHHAPGSLFARPYILLGRVDEFGRREFLGIPSLNRL